MAKNITKLKHRFPLKQALRLTDKFWPIFLLVAIISILAFLNYQPKTWFTGWDNLHPEFFYSMNIRRSIFAVWQEYQSLGLLGGMGHASDLVRQLLMSGFYTLIHLPPATHRYLWTFAMLTLGPVGAYFTIRYFLQHKFDRQTTNFASFLGALFYLLNLATIQYFNTTFESFSTFYGFLPWIIFVLINYLTKPSIKNYLLLTICLLLSAPAFYIETLFVVLILCLLPIFVEFLHSHKFKSKSWLITGNCLLTAGFTQAYWLLPVAFFVATNGRVGTLAKINLISTPEIYARNLEFANIKDLALLKGFWFNFLDLTNNQKFDYLMPVWRAHINLFLMQFIGLGLFLLVLIGIYYSFKKKLHFTKAFFSFFLIGSFFLLGGGLLLSGLPLVGELFRSPFTKFSAALAFTYSIFFAVGAIFLLDLFSFLHNRLTYILTLFSVTLLLVIYTTPAFTGNLISPTMRLKIPQEYFDTFNFFKNQDPATRIANFPQYTFWGWNYYNWGYRGSGFLWYGIKQPILDRAFDVWEKSGEKYFEDINTAIFNESQKEFETLIDKYAVNWLLIDKNVIPPSPTIDLGNDKLQNIIDKSSKFTLAANFNDRVLIYKTNVDQHIKNFLSLKRSDLSNEEVRPLDNLSLRPFSPEISNNQISLSRQLPAGSWQLDIPSYSDTENLVPVGIAYRKTATGLTLKFLPLLPNIKTDEQTIYPPPLIPNYVNLNFSQEISGIVLGLNGQYYEIQLPEETTAQLTYSPLITAYLPTKKNLNLTLYSNHPDQTVDLTNSLSRAQPYQCYTDKPNRQAEKIVDAQTISLFGTDMVGCLSATLPPAPANNLISLEFSYLSHTNTPANANVTDSSLGGTTSPQPLIARDQPTFTRLFTPWRPVPLQVNLILEANEVKTNQEIIYQNIKVNFLPLLSQASVTLNHIPSTQFIPSPSQGEGKGGVSAVLPILDNTLTVSSTPKDNHFSARPTNCDNFNQGKIDRQISQDGFLYSAQNANSCDQVNLKHLPHNTNYLILLDAKNRRGLAPTVCLENYTTRRCDVFERLIDGPQALIQPLANPNEPPGYTLHLFNQSFGSRKTENLIRSVTVLPFPLNFLKNITFFISFSSDGDTEGGSSEVKPVTNSSHPAEFLYTATINNQQSTISLYQTRSPYWKALEVSESDLKLPLWQLILKLPQLYLSSPRLVMNRAEGPGSWYNSWSLPPGNHSLIVFYLPQYLEFLGFLLLPLPFIFVIMQGLLSPLRRGNKKGS